MKFCLSLWLGDRLFALIAAISADEATGAASPFSLPLCCPTSLSFNNSTQLRIAFNEANDSLPQTDNISFGQNKTISRRYILSGVGNPKLVLVCYNFSQGLPLTLPHLTIGRTNLKERIKIEFHIKTDIEQ